MIDRMPAGSQSKHRYYPELDGVRAFAALLIMTFHAWQDGMPVKGPVTFGQTGVDLFFVLSGFLITSILLSARPRDWTEVRTFYVRRSLRIFPLYYGFLIVSTLVGRLVAWQYWVYLQNFWASNTWRVPGPNHFWSLAVEEQFYLVWPFLVLYAPRRYLPRILWGIVVFSAVVRFGLATYLPRHDIFGNTFTRADTLAAGALLAVWHRSGALARHKERLVTGLWVLGGLMTVASLARGERSIGLKTFKYDLIEGFYVCLLGVVLLGLFPAVNKMLRARAPRFLGRVSYGLYIFHPLAFSWTFRILAGWPWLVRGAAGFVAALGMAVTSWYAYERHFLGLKERLAPEPRSTPHAPVSI
jgi:peptidoglycan/LPS O-acetylase OafA/YrhL